MISRVFRFFFRLLSFFHFFFLLSDVSFCYPLFFFVFRSVSRTPRAVSKVGGDCHPKPGVAAWHQAETAPYWTHLAGTAPCRRAAGQRARKLHTAGSGRVTAQEELGNGYLRGKLLPLVDKKHLLLFLSFLSVAS